MIMESTKIYNQTLENFAVDMKKFVCEQFDSVKKHFDNKIGEIEAKVESLSISTVKKTE